LLLVSGATYGSAYWDLTPALSVVQAEAKAGFSVLTYDRLGIGQSTKPASTLLTVQSDADVLHQLVQAARAGRLGQTVFATILTVGHSLGSGIVLTEAATAQDVQGVVVTGFAHYFDPTGGASFQGALWPAQSEPRADLQATPPGYFTTQPGKRSIFYYNGDATVIATDEATKQTVTDGELTSFPSVVTDGGATSQQIRVPVLGLVGDHERFFCSAVGCPEAATEGQYYSAAATFQMQVIKNTGHALATQASSPQTSAIIAGWAWSVVRTS
jgi:pimeloyl-ACP methyl ester carboxylesterase